MSRIWHNRKARAGLGILVAFMAVSVLGPFFVADPLAFSAVPLEPPSYDHWLGTTGAGQDVFAQTVVGARTTLLISFFVGTVVVAVGAVVGTAAGYFGGWMDDLLSLLINIFLIMPGLPLMVVLAAYMPQGPVTIAVVLAVTSWAWSARVVRAQTLTLRSKDFVLAAKVSGENSLRIVVVELLPNMASLIVSAWIGAIVYAMLAQVGLEFLGLGDSSVVSWGTNLYWAYNDAALLTGSWWIFVPTGVCIACVGFALALLNFGIDEVTNPKLASMADAKSEVGIANATPVRRAPQGREEAGTLAGATHG